MEKCFLYRMHLKRNLARRIFQDANPMLDEELSSMYGICGAEGLEEDDYFAMPELRCLNLNDIPVLIKYGYVVSRVEVSAWGEVYDENDNLVECLFKMRDVVSVEEIDLRTMASKP